MGQLIFSDSFLDIVHAHDSGVVLSSFCNLINIRARAGVGKALPFIWHAVGVQ